MAIHPKYQLLISHGLSAWGDRMWSFSIGLYLVILSPTSLRLTAFYGLILASSILLLGSTIGLWIDLTPRAKAAKIALSVQNASVVICCVLLCLTLTYGPSWEEEHGSWTLLVAHIAVIITADVAALFSEAQKIILERDWIVVIAGDDPDDLARMNSMFRTLDLTTYILAPLLVGGIMSSLSPVVAAVIIASWNVVSFAVEYTFLSMIFRRVPTLAKPKDTFNPDGSCEQDKRRKRSWYQEAAHAWKLYFSQPLAVAGFGLASLYMTVLGYDSVTSGYLYSQGVPEWAVGLGNGSGALFGIFGALLFPVLHRKYSLRTSAVVGFGSFAAVASGALVSAFLPGSPFEVYKDQVAVKNDTSTEGTAGESLVAAAFEGPFQKNPSIMTFMISLVASRACLWIADLSVTQSIQETVEASVRGEINGVQSSLNYSMEVVKFGLVAILPKPKMFGYLILASELFYVMAFICSCRYATTYKKESRRKEMAIYSLGVPPFNGLVKVPSGDSLVTLRKYVAEEVGDQQTQQVNA